MSTFLTGAGCGPFLGVPCGILAPLFTELDAAAGVIYTPREDSAIAMACGSALAGRDPVVLMQNSGLAQSVNVLASLVIPYGFPIGMVVSLRGSGEDNTAENQVMGRATGPILDSLGVPYRVLGEATGADLRWWQSVVRQGGRAAALLIPPDYFGWSCRQ
jgi:sulfopyruvate decarboxylase subunit alpha/phosphonopyruvate decarboxylase